MSIQRSAFALLFCLLVPVLVYGQQKKARSQPEWTRELYFAQSPNRFSLPLIGADSKDGRYRIALASSKVERITQGVLDCLHNIPLWLPEAAPLEERTWRVKVYLSEDGQSPVRVSCSGLPRISPRRFARTRPAEAASDTVRSHEDPIS